MQLLAVAIGGAVGALMRWATSAWIAAWLGRDFPYGTLLINVSGSLLMGLLYVMLVERGSVALEWRALLMVGLLGSFTTFATFSVETVRLLEQGQLISAVANVLASVVLCLLAVWLGMQLGRQG